MHKNYNVDLLSVKDKPKIAGPTAPATASTRFWQRISSSVKKVCFYCSMTIAQLLIVEKIALTVHFTDLMSNRSKPPTL